jgi:hypothetical protein
MNTDSQRKEPIVLDILRVSSPDVLGETKQLSVASPFMFSNAQGELKDVDSFEQIRKIASESGARFKTVMTASKAKH